MQGEFLSKATESKLESSHYVMKRTVVVPHDFGSSTRWNAQVNVKINSFSVYLVAPPAHW